MDDERLAELAAALSLLTTLLLIWIAGRIFRFGQVQSFDAYIDTVTLPYRSPDRLAATEVILPEGLLERISRHAVELGGHREQLRALGQHLKRGILLSPEFSAGLAHLEATGVTYFPDPHLGRPGDVQDGRRVRSTAPRSGKMVA